METVFVARQVARKLRATEDSIDAALNQTAELLQDVLKAPVDAGVSPTIADETQVKVMAALKALSEARTAVVEAHEQAYRAGRRAGITRMGLDASGPSLHNEERVSMEDARDVG